MKTLVLYHSFTGKTRKVAENLAEKKRADIIEIKEKGRRSKFGAYIFGSLAARAQRETELEPINSDFSKYDKIVIAMPIWAGYPAPAINGVINRLPSDKVVELFMTSSHGNSKKSSKKTMALIESKGCIVTEYHDIKR